MATARALAEETPESKAAGGPSLPGFWRRHEHRLLGIVAVLTFLIAWQWAGTSGIVSPLFTSAPSRIARAFVISARSGELARDVTVSGEEFVYGFGLSILVGIPLGILMGWYRRLDALFDPFVNAFNATPRVALLPLLIIWLGIGINSKVAIVFIGAVFAVLISTISGIRNLDDALIRVARSYGASDFQLLRTVALPGSVPFIVSGIRLGLGHALVGVVIGELYGSTAGVGYLISLASNNFQTDRVFVGVAIVAAAGMFFTAVLRRVETHFQSWRPQRPAG
jgi:ABC-type nitrate/sulfonate/bicarbonate transport system permease component